MASGLKLTPMLLLLGIALIFIVGFLIGRSKGKVVERFADAGPAMCNRCRKRTPCGCPVASDGQDVADMLNMPAPPEWHAG